MPIDSELSSIDAVALLKEARSGQVKALTQLLRRHRNYLLLLAESELDSELRVKASCSDVVQETLLEAQQSFDGFRGTEPHQWQQWLQMILRNNVKDLRHRYVEAAKRSIPKEVAGLDIENRANTPSEDSPSRLPVRKEQIHHIEAYLRDLPDQYQNVLWLRFWQELSYDQIAAQLGGSNESVRQILYRAVEALVIAFRSGDR